MNDREPRRTFHRVIPGWPTVVRIRNVYMHNVEVELSADPDVIVITQEFGALPYAEVEEQTRDGGLYLSVSETTRSSDRSIHTQVGGVNVTGSQNNVAVGGMVFAVQNGTQTVHHSVRPGSGRIAIWVPKGTAIVVTESQEVRVHGVRGPVKIIAGGTQRTRVSYATSVNVSADENARVTAGPTESLTVNLDGLASVTARGGTLRVEGVATGKSIVDVTAKTVTGPGIRTTQGATYVVNGEDQAIPKPGCGPEFWDI